MGNRSTIVGCLGVAALLASAGVRAALSDEDSAIDVLLRLAIGCSVAMVCVMDSRRIGRVMPGAAAFGIVFLWPIAVPVYLLWSRGWRRGLLLTVAFVLSVAIVLLVPFFIAGYAVWGDEFSRGG